MIRLADCIVRLHQGERIAPQLAACLEPIDPASMGAFTIDAEQPTELHYHGFDEYWMFSDGQTTVTLRSEDGTAEEFEVTGGDLVVTPKGVEHGHVPRTSITGYQFTSKLGPGVEQKHLYRQ